MVSLGLREREKKRPLHKGREFKGGGVRQRHYCLLKITRQAYQFKPRELEQQMAFDSRA